MILAIDFNHVLHDRDNPIGRMGAPIQGAKQAMDLLREQGHELIIHSDMARTEGGVKAIEEWCQYYGIPFDRVTALKPTADIFLDDKALRFQSWRKAVKDIAKWQS